MEVNEAVVKVLTENGIDTVFGIPGTQSLPLNETIDGREDIRFVMARHETAAPHSAWGYAETSDNLAATVVIPGPGDMNSMNGLKNALNDCTPLLHLAVETEPYVRGGDGIHETPPNTYDNVVKENITVATPESAAAEVQRAIAIAESPPKGPVRVGIPKNFLDQDITIAETGDFDRKTISGVPATSIDRAADILAGASKPLVIAGGGIRAASASEELFHVAEKLDAPIVTTYKGRGVFPERHDLFAGILSVGSTDQLLDLIAASDAALGVGTDFDAVTTQQWSVTVPDQLVHITLHADDLGTAYRPEVGIVADAKEALAAIENRLEGRDCLAEDGAKRAQRVRENDAALMADALSVDTPPLTSASAEAAIDDVLTDDTIVSVDAGGFRIWSLHVLEINRPDGFVDTGSWATMGTGLPAAIGAQLANPDRDIIGLMGDGGLLMCLHELHTAAVENIPVVAVVLNNNDYATISAEAAENFDFPDGAYEWDEVPVSFEAIAEELGVDAYHAETPDKIRTTLERALNSDQPSLVEIPTDPREPQAKPLD